MPNKQTAYPDSPAIFLYRALNANSDMVPLVSPARLANLQPLEQRRTSGGKSKMAGKDLEQSGRRASRWSRSSISRT
jgi:hypothetical protein